MLLLLLTSFLFCFWIKFSCFLTQPTPHIIIKRIEAWEIWQLYIRGYMVAKMLSQQRQGSSRYVAWLTVARHKESLLPTSRSRSARAPPGTYIDLFIDSEAMLENKWRHNVTIPNDQPQTPVCELGACFSLIGIWICPQKSSYWTSDVNKSHLTTVWE